MVEFARTLLSGKTVPPDFRLGSVSRGDLIRTARESGCRVVAVTAPAGYGKTTLLAQWAELEDRPVAWVSLSRLDDDAGTLLTLVASSVSAVIPGNESLVADVGGIGISALGRAAPRLASALQSSPVPFVLMLDDLHELQSPACHDVLSIITSGIPRGSQLAIASRIEQPYLPRLRAEGDVCEFVARDLAFDTDGAEQVFAATAVSVTHEVAETVTEHTEGWPVALYLAAVISRDGGELTISGDDPYVADYLYREYLSTASDEVQHFLRSTAVLDQMCAPLCDALLGGTGAQESLRQLEASNLFITPLDRHRNWYRYHPLFREFLLAELRRAEPEAIPELHLRAADWYLANGTPGLALEHLLDTPEQARSAELMTQLALPTYQAGRMSTLQRWLTTIGIDAAEQYPPLAVMAGWVAVMSGEVPEAQRWGAIIESATYESPTPDGTESFASSRAMLRGCMCPAGAEEMLADASYSVAHEPEWSPWRDTALCVLGEALLLCGDPDSASAVFAEAAAVARVTGNVNSIAVSESELAVLAMDHGRWGEAAERLEAAIDVIDQHGMHDYATSVLSFAAAARLALHRGDRVETDRQLTRAMRARPNCTYTLPYFAVRARLQLAKVCQALGDPTTAHHLVAEIDDVLLHRPRLGALVDEVSEFREAVAATSLASPGGSVPLTPAELRVLPYLQTHLTKAEIGGRLFVSSHTISSQVGSIYRKLGVSSRSEAVQLATAVGLLGA